MIALAKSRERIGGVVMAKKAFFSVVAGFLLAGCSGPDLAEGANQPEAQAESSLTQQAGKTDELIAGDEVSATHYMVSEESEDAFVSGDAVASACRRVDTYRVNVYTSATGSDLYGWFYQGTKFMNLGEENGRIVNWWPPGVPPEQGYPAWVQKSGTTAITCPW